MSRVSGNVMADAWGRRFLKNLVAGLKASGSDDGLEVARRAARATRMLVDERMATGTDQNARSIVGLCSFVLAGYRETRAEIGDQAAAVSIVREAFARTYRVPTSLAIRLWLRLVRDPVKMMTKLPLTKLCRVMYGSTMGFEQEVGEDHTDLVVTRCAYHQFFVESGEPALTRVFCGWDRNWMDVIDASPRPIRTERPTTFSTGGDCCRFRFLRDASGEPKPTRDIVSGG